MGENPAWALSWEEPLIQEAFQGMPEAVVDQCMFGKRRPDTQQLVRKTTRIKADEEICSRLRVRCDKSHNHGLIEGRLQGTSTCQ